MVERAFKLLDLLASSEAGYSLSELARLLAYEQRERLRVCSGRWRKVEWSRSMKIAATRWDPASIILTQAYIHGSGLRRFALPAMQRLAATTGETVFLGLVEPDGIRIVDLVEIPSEQTALRLSARSGAHIHLPGRGDRAGSAGELAGGRRREYLLRRPLPRFTENSITDQDAYLAAVAETARTGVGVDREEYLAGVSAVAVGDSWAGRRLAGPDLDHRLQRRISRRRPRAGQARRCWRLSYLAFAGGDPAGRVLRVEPLAVVYSSTLSSNQGSKRK